MSTRRAGFTLIELLVALTVGALVVAAVQAAVGVVATMRSGSDHERARVLTELNGRESLRSWLRGAALLDSLPGVQGTPADLATGRSARLALTVADGGVLRPGPHRITIWANTDPLRPPTGLLAALEPVGAGASAGADTLVVVPSATWLTARYLTLAEGAPKWEDRWSADSLLPLAIELDPSGDPFGEAGGPLAPIAALPLVTAVAAATW